MVTSSIIELKTRVTCDCCRCVKSFRGLTETQLQEEEQLCSHMLGGISKHMPAHTHTHAHTLSQPQSSCRDALTRSAQKHWHASGGRHTFQLMSGSFSAVTAKICPSVCGFQRETLPRVHACTRVQHLLHVCATIQHVTITGWCL